MSKPTRITDCRIIDLPKILDQRGNLSFVEQLRHVPFTVERAYWIYDVPGDSQRGGHAFCRTEEFIVALSGSFDVVLDDGEQRKHYHLNRSYYGLFVPKMIWREMDNFSTNSVALVLSSSPYDDADYIRDYELFKCANR